MLAKYASLTLNELEYGSGSYMTLTYWRRQLRRPAPHSWGVVIMTSCFPVNFFHPVWVPKTLSSVYFFKTLLCVFFEELTYAICHDLRLPTHSVWMQVLGVVAIYTGDSLLFYRLRFNSEVKYALLYW